MGEGRSCRKRQGRRGWEWKFEWGWEHGRRRRSAPQVGDWDGTWSQGENVEQETVPVQWGAPQQERGDTDRELQPSAYALVGESPSEESDLKLLVRAALGSASKISRGPCEGPFSCTE